MTMTRAHEAVSFSPKFNQRSIGSNLIAMTLAELLLRPNSRRLRLPLPGRLELPGSRASKRHSIHELKLQNQHSLSPNFNQGITRVTVHYPVYQYVSKKRT